MHGARRFIIAVFAVLLTGAAVVGLCPTTVAHDGIDQQIADLNGRIVDDPQNATLFLRPGELHRIHRDWDKALADFDRALALDSDLIIVERCVGKLKIESDKPAEAIASLDRYLERRSGDVEAHALRGRALARLGHSLEAAESYTLALANVGEGKPKPEFFLERARALAAAGNEHIPRAVAGLDEGLVVLAQPVTLQLYAIELELKGKHYDSALARLDQIAGRSIRKETWLVRRGQILEIAGRPEEARAAYSQTLEEIEALPAHRRSNRAVSSLENEARSALERLDAKPARE